MQIGRCFLQYFLAFCALCAVNHCFSVALFTMCGYCLLTYAFVYTFLLVTISLFLSTAVYHILIRKDEKNKILQDLSAVSYEDIPYVMVWLINKSKERESNYLTSNEKEVTPEGEPCVACYENMPVIKNMPCGHTVLCKSCNWNLLRISIENRSPLICSWCRTGIKDFCGEMRPDLDLVEWGDIKGALNELEMLKTKRKRSVGSAR